MLLVFVDANIYLDSYRRVMPKYRKLLTALLEIQESLLVTHTVSEEVERNRVAAYRDNNKLQTFDKTFSLLDLQSHHADDTSAVEALNQQVRQLQNDIKRKAGDLFCKLAEVHEKNLMSIVTGEDDVSRALRPLFEKAVSDTPEQFERAKIRKERGRPPGKRGDPLGDQISWEQILDAAKGKESVWIVTKDKDYTESVADALYLKPPLHRELMAVEGVREVRCFSNLASFFKEFRKAGAVQEEHLPPQETVEEAGEEIRREIVTPPMPSYIRGMSDLDIAIHNREIAWPPTCAKSPTGQHRMPGLAPRPSSAFGGWTYQGICSNCGVMVDTGDPYED